MKVMAYISDKKDYMFNLNHYKNIDHIYYCFAKILDTKGTMQFPSENINNLAKIRKINPNVTISLSIGGWGAGNFSEMAESKASRKQFIDQVINFVEKYQFDGIDMDWEYPTVGSAGISYHYKDKENYTKLSDELRASLDELVKKNQQKYYLSLAIGAYEGSLKSFDVDCLNRNYDYLNIMNYDYIGMDKLTCHHANLYPSKSTPHKKSADYFMQMFENAGLKRKKIVFGLPFYGRGGTKVKTQGNGLSNRIYGELPQFFDYDNIETKIANNPQAYQYDEDAQAAYYSDGETFISFENEKSLRKKIEYVKAKEYMGIMFWEYNTDKNGTLLTIINKLLETSDKNS